jgi:hypothetical protein
MDNYYRKAESHWEIKQSTKKTIFRKNFIPFWQNKSLTIRSQFLQETTFFRTPFCVMPPNFRPVSHQAWPETGLVWPAPRPGPAQREGIGPARHDPPLLSPGPPTLPTTPARPAYRARLGWHIGQKKKTGFGLVPVADLTPPLPQQTFEPVFYLGGGGGSRLIFFFHEEVSRFWIVLCVQRRWTWTGDLKCREVKTGFYRNRSMQTGSSETLIGWKSGQTTFVPLWDWMEGAWLRTQLKG